jgi:hypothetical protein
MSEKSNKKADKTEKLHWKDVKMIEFERVLNLYGIFVPQRRKND